MPETNEYFARGTDLRKLKERGNLENVAELNHVCWAIKTHRKVDKCFKENVPSNVKHWAYDKYFHYLFQNASHETLNKFVDMVSQEILVSEDKINDKDGGFLNFDV